MMESEALACRSILAPSAACSVLPALHAPDLFLIRRHELHARPGQAARQRRGKRRQTQRHAARKGAARNVVNYRGARSVLRTLVLCQSANTRRIARPMHRPAARDAATPRRLATGARGVGSGASGASGVPGAEAERCDWRIFLWDGPPPETARRAAARRAAYYRGQAAWSVGARAGGAEH